MLMESKEFLSGMGIAIHIRTTRADNFRGAYSFISGCAIRAGSIVFEVMANGDLAVNGEVLFREEDDDDDDATIHG